MTDDIVEEVSKPPAGARSTLGDALLRDYRSNLDPLNTHDLANVAESATDHAQRSMDQVRADPSVRDASQQSQHSPSRSLSARRSILAHGMRPPPAPMGSHRSVFRTLATKTSQEGLHQDKFVRDHPKASTSFAAQFLRLPCFFHQRFEDAVNVNRVLEEVAADDDGISHSRLLQTATSVREISKQLQRRPIKRAVRAVMIITKARDNSLVYLTRDLADWLLRTPRYGDDLGVVVYVDAKLKTSKRFDAAGLIASDPRFKKLLAYWTPDMCLSSPDQFDLVLTLGGDGTVLYTSWLFQRIVPPVLSFSLGTLGFLTNFTFTDYKSTLDRIMEGSGMRVNMRMRFTCTVYRAKGHNNISSKGSSATNLSSYTSNHLPSTSSVSASTTPTTSFSGNAPSSATSLPSASPASLTAESTFEVLNELVLDRGPSPYVSNLELYGDDHLITIIQADGVIISTPTGSTAYSLSAGGPLTHPSIPGILLTPICPHTLSFRPMVLSDSLMLRLVVPKHSRGGAYASFDGKGRVELRKGDEVRVEVGRYPFPTVVGEGGTGGEWFESVRRALRWNTRGAVQGSFGHRVGREDKVEDGMLDELERVSSDLDGQSETADWDIDAESMSEDEVRAATASAASTSSPGSKARSMGASLSQDGGGLSSGLD